MLSGGLADPGLAFELVPVIDRACLVRGARAPVTYREGRRAPSTRLLSTHPWEYLRAFEDRWSACSRPRRLECILYTRRRTLSVFAGEAGTVVAPNTQMPHWGSMYSRANTTP